MRARSKVLSTVILVAVFAVNYVETAIESRIQPLQERSIWAAYTFQAMEGRDFFKNHELTSEISVYGYSISYFFIMALLAIAVVAGLIVREDGRDYRVMSLAVAINYLICLPFFLFFPVPERWTHAETGAILLSDRWSSALIEALRPISGLDNCFPSFHTSFSVIIVLIWYQARLPGRNLVAVLGLSIVLSTFVLGIHWIPDILAGLAVGVLSLQLARRAERAAAGQPAASAPAAA